MAKPVLHLRNIHHERYNFKVLVKAVPELKEFIYVNEHDKETIDFTNAAAIKTLNKSLLIYHYGLEYWDIPPGYLCPPIPGRANYIHTIADLLQESNNGVIPTGRRVQILDIGVGSNCVYPIIGNKVYGWKFSGSEIDEVAFKSAKNIVYGNKHLQGLIDLRFQKDSNYIFEGVLRDWDYFDACICNPPFHDSPEAAEKANQRKWKKLGYGEDMDLSKVHRNYSGSNTELWYKGGEVAFISKIIEESQKFERKVFWFTTLVSQKQYIPPLHKKLLKAKAKEIKIIEMRQGQKLSRILCWTFHPEWLVTQWKTKFDTNSTTKKEKK